MANLLVAITGVNGTNEQGPMVKWEAVDDIEKGVIMGETPIDPSIVSPQLLVEKVIEDARRRHNAELGTVTRIGDRVSVFGSVEVKTLSTEVGVIEPTMARP